MSKVVELEKFIEEKAKEIVEPRPIFLYQVELEKDEDRNYTQLITLSEALLMILGKEKVDRIAKTIEKCTLDIDKIIKE